MFPTLPETASVRNQLRCNKINAEMKDGATAVTENFLELHKSYMDLEKRIQLHDKDDDLNEGGVDPKASLEIHGRLITQAIKFVTLCNSVIKQMSDLGGSEADRQGEVVAMRDGPASKTEGTGDE